MEKLKRFIICTKQDDEEIELINEFGFFRFEYEVKRKVEILGKGYYYKAYYL